MDFILKDSEFSIIGRLQQELVDKVAKSTKVHFLLHLLSIELPTKKKPRKKTNKEPNNVVWRVACQF